jgi:HK97 family phage portal protein
MLVSSGLAIPTGTDLADASPMRNPYYYASTGLALASTFAAYAELYKVQPWVYVLVNKTAKAAARLPLKVFERVSDTDRAEARDTPYGDLIRKPNPRIGAKLLWLWTFSTAELYGESMLLKLRDDRGRVRELQPVHPSNMLVRRGDDGNLEYAYMAYSQSTPALATFPASEIVHFRGYNPENVTRGLSPCEPLRQTLIAEDAMRRAQTALWKNGARPSMALSTDKTLSDTAFKRLEASWNAKHTGVDAWAKTAILEEGLKPMPYQLNADEMQYIAGRQLNREECCAVWDVPPPAVQILDRATFSNITEQMRSLYRETMTPRIEAYEDVLDSQLAPDFDSTGTLYAEFSLDAVLRGSFEARIAAKAQAIGTGQMTPAESRAEENLPFLEGSDQLLVNAALIPLKVVEQVALPTGDQVTQLPQRVKALSARDAAKVDRRLAKAATVADVDEDALLLNLDDGEEVRGLLRAAVAHAVDLPTLRRWVAASVELEEPACL